MLDFGDELVAMKANRADSDPLPLDADVAHPDVALLDPWLAFMSSAFDAIRAKVVRLKLHSRYTIKLGRFRGALFFRKTIHSYPFVVCLGCGKGKPLGIASLSSAVIGLDGHDTIELTRDTASLIGDGDDIVELLATVDRNGDLTPLSL